MTNAARGGDQLFEAGLTAMLTLAGVGAGVLAAESGARQLQHAADLLAPLAHVVDGLLQPELTRVGERRQRPVKLATGQAPDVLADG